MNDIVCRKKFICRQIFTFCFSATHNLIRIQSNKNANSEIDDANFIAHPNCRRAIKFNTFLPANGLSRCQQPNTIDIWYMLGNFYAKNIMWRNSFCLRFSARFPWFSDLYKAIMDSKLELRHWPNKNGIFVATYRLRFHLRHNSEKPKRKNIFYCSCEARDFRHHAFHTCQPDDHALRLCKCWRQLHYFTF